MSVLTGKPRESGFNLRLVFGVVNKAQTPHEHGDRKQLPSGKHHVTTNIRNHQMTTENSATKEQIDEHNKPENHDRETMVELQAVQSLNHHPNHRNSAVIYISKSFHIRRLENRRW